ncbi:MAG: CHAT domain-containing protein [Planctomycetota bacterium]
MDHTSDAPQARTPLGRGWAAGLIILMAIGCFAADLHAQGGQGAGNQGAGGQGGGRPGLGRPGTGTGMLGGFEPGGQYPSPIYYRGLDAYRVGNIRAALDLFEVASRNVRLDIRGKWLDSIPSLAMAAECRYQLGDCVGANELVEKALGIAIRHAGWLNRVNWVSVEQPNVNVTKPSWLWPAAQKIDVLVISRRADFVAGQTLTPEALTRGGAIEEPNIRGIDIGEVMRCLAVAAHRRRVLLGPLATAEPLATEAIASISQTPRQMPPGAVSMLASMRTCFQSAVGSDQDARAGLRTATLGNRVHKLSPIAMLTALRGFSSYKNTNDQVAGCLQTAHVAAASEQYEWVGPALELAAGYCNEQTAGGVAEVAMIVARSTGTRSRMVCAHAATAAADAAITAGRLDLATQAIVIANEALGHRSVGVPRIEAYAAYVSARLASAQFASGIDPTLEPAATLAKLDEFTAGRTVKRQTWIACPRVFQMQRIEALVRAAAGAKSAGQLISIYASDPPDWLWRTDPVDALGSMRPDRTPLHRLRLELAASASDGAAVMAATDDYFADRFHRVLPLGGRRATVRFLSWADKDLLNPETRRLVEANGPLARLRDLVTAQGADPTHAGTLEALATFVALERRQLPRAALPPLVPKDEFPRMDADTMLLSMVVVNRSIILSASWDGQTRTWSVPASPVLSSVQRYLQAIGVRTDRGPKLPGDDTAREQVDRLRRLVAESLIPDPNFLNSLRVKRIWVIPDGGLWYLPFELLPVDEDTLLGDRFDIRYAPTPGCTRVAAGPPASNPQVAVAADEFFSGDTSIDSDYLKRIIDAPRAAIPLGGKSATPTSMIGSVAGHLAVASARVAPAANPLLLVPAPSDPAGPQGTIAAWLRYPHNPPATVSLFGLRSQISQGKLGDGSELFGVLCAMRCAAVREVLLSRWAVGGESTAILMDEFIQELPVVGMGNAWMRSRQILRQMPISPAAERLLSKSEYEREDIMGDEPLFWAGYLLSSPD